VVLDAPGQCVACIVNLRTQQVKNVTGRYLVGLRFWNEAVEGGSAWRFETLREVCIGIMWHWWHDMQT
jgi:hypothetical protein